MEDYIQQAKAKVEQFLGQPAKSKGGHVRYYLAQDIENWDGYLDSLPTPLGFFPVQNRWDFLCSLSTILGDPFMRKEDRMRAQEEFLDKYTAYHSQISDYCIEGDNYTTPPLFIHNRFLDALEDFRCAGIPSPMLKQNITKEIQLLEMMFHVFREQAETLEKEAIKSMIRHKIEEMMQDYYSWNNAPDFVQDECRHKIVAYMGRTDRESAVMKELRQEIMDELVPLYETHDPECRSELTPSLQDARGVLDKIKKAKDTRDCITFLEELQKELFPEKAPGREL